MPSSLFWNQPPDRDPTRSVDPLGFDALREAMADKLVPLLTGATRDADEYLWTADRPSLGARSHGVLD